MYDLPAAKRPEKTASFLEVPSALMMTPLLDLLCGSDEGRKAQVAVVENTTRRSNLNKDVIMMATFVSLCTGPCETQDRQKHTTAGISSSTARRK